MNEISDDMFKQYLCWIVDNYNFTELKKFLIELEDPSGIELLPIFLKEMREQKLNEILK